MPYLAYGRTHSSVQAEQSSARRQHQYNSRHSFRNRRESRLFQQLSKAIAGSNRRPLQQHRRSTL